MNIADKNHQIHHDIQPITRSIIKPVYGFLNGVHLERSEGPSEDSPLVR